MSDLSARRSKAVEQIRGYGGLLVALSGGVDSAVLLALAAEALAPPNLHAVTAVSEAVPARDLNDARAVARHLGVPHEVIRTDELAVPGYRENSGNRCFHCRSELFRLLFGLARTRGLAEVAYGAIEDDVRDVRPGMRAAAEWGVRAPLLDAGIDKAAVRALARAAKLPVADKPAAACLASRIPTGTPVTTERLLQIEKAENALRRLGFGQVRVRHHGEVARVELDSVDLGRLSGADLRARVSGAVKEAGFRYCTVDLDGYREGGRDPTVLPSMPLKREGGQ